MKILLTLILCSNIAGECMPPFEWPVEFNSYYDCLQQGNVESYAKLEEIGPEDVNKYQMFIKFTCDVSDKVQT